MVKRLSMFLAAALGLASVPLAHADADYMTPRQDIHFDRQDIRHGVRDIRQDRRDIHGDMARRWHEHRELMQARRQGDFARAAHERDELHAVNQDLRRDRFHVRHDMRHLRHERRDVRRDFERD